MEARTSFTNDTIGSAFYFETQTNINSTSSFSPGAYKPCKNLILINPDNLIWLESFAPGYYLDRYFGLLDLDGNAEAGICEMGKRTDYLPNFYQQSEGQIFGNTSEYNTSNFYAITRTQNSSTSGYLDDTEINLKPFYHRLR